jgi:protein SCO1/2
LLPNPARAQARAAVTNKRIQAVIWGALAAIVAAIVLAFFVFRPKPAPLPAYGMMPEFVLQDQDGRAVHLSDLRGKVWVADVIFTRCAGQCPLMSAHLQAISRRIPASAPIRFVSFTTDPAFDTPAVMKKYAQRYAADESRWLFLTGGKPALRAVIVDGLKLTAMDKAAATQENPADLFVHSAKFVLIDGTGQIRGYYDGETEASIAQVADAAEQLAQNP